MIKQIRRLEDLEGVRPTDMVIVHTIADTSKTDIPLTHLGIIFECYKNRFSIVEEIITDMPVSIGKINYNWSSACNTFHPSYDETFKFSPREITMYERLLD